VLLLAIGDELILLEEYNSTEKTGYEVIDLAVYVMKSKLFL
jgi:hypothetical protein